MRRKDKWRKEGAGGACERRNMARTGKWRRANNKEKLKLKRSARNMVNRGRYRAREHVLFYLFIFFTIKKTVPGQKQKERTSKHCS